MATKANEIPPVIGDVATSVDDAITSRQSVRAYLDRPVSRDTVDHLLDVARYAPSGTNTQPWLVYVTGGDVKQRMCDAILADCDQNPERNDREFEYYPTEWFEPYLARRRACGWGLYGALGIQRGEKEKMHAQRTRNYDFFGAPVGLILTIDRKLNTGSWMDVGMFLQNILIAARGQGLHTCAQAAFANYHRIIREHLPIPDEQIVVCGVSLGYGDMQAPENVWRTEREPVESFTQWFGM